MKALKLVEDNSTPFELETIEHQRHTTAKEVEKFFTEETIAVADVFLGALDFEVTLEPMDD